jgi:selenocysteine lyase/cysteine desulfurase
MISQKLLFSLPEGLHYLNCAYKGPMMKTAEAAGMEMLLRDRNPSVIAVDDYFNDNAAVRSLFGKLVNCAAEHVAIIPSTSYGFASALDNISGKPGGKAIGLHNEFPSAYFSLERWCNENQQEREIIGPETNDIRQGEAWNAAILEAIDARTSVVLISWVHWMNGVRFDLEAIGKKCREVGAKFLVDGTQAVGLLEMDVQKFHIDALVCAAYKWMFGPYSTALAYFGEAFSNGRPLEETWMNRMNAKDFSNLTAYDPVYRPAAGRFNVGQTSNFILMPILRRSLEQILEWQPSQMETYCRNLTAALCEWLKSRNIEMEDARFLAPHLFALPLPAQVSGEQMKEVLAKRNIVISVRGSYLRVSVNVFNEPDDMAALIAALEELS